MEAIWKPDVETPPPLGGAEALIRLPIQVGEGATAARP